MDFLDIKFEEKKINDWIERKAKSFITNIVWK
jgi:hypothetical protein